MDGIEEFNSAVKAHLAPVAKMFGLKFERLEERVYAMRSATVAVKVYFPHCHGYDITVCLSPTFDPAWNSEEERGLAWYLSFIGEKKRLPDRVGTFTSAIDPLVSGYVTPLTSVLHRFSKSTPRLWEEFYAFFEAQTKNA